MSAARIFLFCGLAVAAAEALLGVLLLGTSLAAYFGVCALATAVLAVLGRRFFEPPDDPGDEPGGGGPEPEPPPWWPEFEAAFRAYLRDRESPRVRG